MRVLFSTDDKYKGAQVPSGLNVGDTLSFADFDLVIQFKRVLENGQIVLGSPNYQLILEE